MLKSGEPQLNELDPDVTEGSEVAPPPPAPGAVALQLLEPADERHVVRDGVEAGLAGSALLLVTSTELQVPLLTVVWGLATLWVIIRWRRVPDAADPARETTGTALGVAAAFAFAGLRCVTVTLAYLGALSILLVAEFGLALLVAWVTMFPVVIVGGVCAAACFVGAGSALVAAVLGSVLRTDD